MLLQLVVERECLKEADFEIQKEIFDRTVYDMRNLNTGAGGGSKDSRKSETATSSSFRYSLQYPHLLEKQQPSPSTNMGHAKGGKGEYAKTKTSGAASVGHLNNNR